MRYGTSVALLLLLVTSRILQGTPVPWIAELEAAAILLALSFTIWYHIVRPLVSRDATIHLLDGYLLLLLLLPFYSAWRSLEVFGQPLIYGILAQRSVWLVAVVLFTVIAIRNNKITFRHIERALIVSSWLSLGAYTFCFAFLDPSNYTDYPMIVSGSVKSGFRFSFETVFIVFGALYYFALAVISRAVLLWLAFLPFAFYLLVLDQKRSLLLAIAISVTMLVIKFTDLPGKVFHLFVGGACIFFILFLFYIVLPETLFAFVDRFGQAFDVLVTGSEGSDDSSNARIQEALKALPYVKANLLLGNGDLSAQWQSGFESVFGYFFISDIGFIGGLFVFGIVGLVILYGMYWFFLRSTKLAKYTGTEHRPLLMSMYGSILVAFFQTFVKAQFFLGPAISAMFIALFWLLTRNNIVRHMAKR
ncbi:MAG: hypothetical protein U9Q81_15865 [Pseudomonadota bacterium]|nr:hypothetical protein [Pseudomonadota bacterium]